MKNVPSCGLGNEDVIAATGMPHGGSGAGPLAHSVERIILLEHDIDDMIGSFVDIRDEITAAIAQVEDGRYRLLLHCRYILGLSWEDIRNRMNYDLRWVHRLHGTQLLACKASSTNAP